MTGCTTYINGTDASEDSIKYYASEYMNGAEQYNYAMINFALDDGETATCPAKILGFVRYNITSGVPTPKVQVLTMHKLMVMTKPFMWLCILRLITCL